ncbi:MAG: sodium-dependent transporter [Tissierellales bacterium]|nr:sodium-dependent transporter [Tissierellales bacterium]
MQGIKEQDSHVEQREQFGSRIGMVLATVGFAAGVGNLWRFPYIVGTNGGGIFLLFYFFIVAIVGIPLLTAEFSIGAATSKNPVGAYRELSKNGKWHLNGYLHLLAAILIAAYTMPVYAWILYYVFNTAIGSLQGLDSNAIGETFDNLISNHGQLFLWSAINVFFIVMVVKKNLQNGIEKISKILLPGLAVIMLALIIKGLTLPNAIEGIKYYLTPDISKFTLNSALAAISQAFFSIGIAMAVSMVFASYMKEKDKEKIVENAVLVTGFDTLVAFAAGFMIFPSVFAFGLEPNVGPGLTFVTMPNVFNQMTGGIIWGTLFYLGFYFAAFTSVIAAWEAPINYFVEEHKMTRKKALTVSAIIIILIAIPATWSMDIFGKLDYIENNFVLVFGALFMTIFVGWIWGIDNFAKAARIKNNTIKNIFGMLIKYINPLIIILLIISQFGLL